ncbi:uncharacterized protein LOC117100242 [Anneissia japonica]|uniref:uncharacterized protein LOC117100242 n=1 Tax=Anneissia japonica TaxID=1529436 RepID=UPI0014255073|nr:uncharacterized protein LOC117100242 [Anneissia japonica]
MTSYVSEKLEEWNLQSLKEIFEENLIDEEAFLLLDVDTIKELIKPVGSRLKFIANLKKLKEDMLPVVVPSHNEHCMQSLNDSLSSDSSEEFIATTSQCSSQSSEEFTEPPRKKIKSVSTFIPHVRALLESSVVGESIIKEIEEGETFCTIPSNFLFSKDRLLVASSGSASNLIKELSYHISRFRLSDLKFDMN